PEGGIGGDKGYAGIDKLHGGGATPRRKPRGEEQSEEDKAYNRAFARERIIVEHGIRRVRRYACLSQADRHYRAKHTERTRAVAGLVNRRLDRQQRFRAA
ncbi:MAG: transposase family protein, partial [Chloroflexi bacterium]|nr:transposase family protein [Chloroflexota bacterium]